MRTLRWQQRRMTVKERQTKISEFCFGRMKGIRIAEVLGMSGSATGPYQRVNNQDTAVRLAYLRVTLSGVSGALRIILRCNLRCRGHQHTPKVSSDAHNSTKTSVHDEHPAFVRRGKGIYTNKIPFFFSRLQTTSTCDGDISTR